MTKNLKIKAGEKPTTAPQKKKLTRKEKDEAFHLMNENFSKGMDLYFAALEKEKAKEDAGKQERSKDMTKQTKPEMGPQKATPKKRYRKLSKAEEEEYTRLINEAWVKISKSIQEGKIVLPEWRRNP